MDNNSVELAPDHQASLRTHIQRATADTAEAVIDRRAGPPKKKPDSIQPPTEKFTKPAYTPISYHGDPKSSHAKANDSLAKHLREVARDKWLASTHKG